MRFSLISWFCCFSIWTIAQDLITIPVVVHVVYNTENQNISDDRIYSQIQALNRDFRKQNADINRVDSRFTDLTADTKIAFKLTHLDPKGNSTTGITRTKTNHAVFGNSDIHYTAKGGIDAWDPTLYLNIWVADLSPSFLGWSGNPSLQNDKDGVVIDFEVFGENPLQLKYNLGRTAVHEVGHWLGLAHPEGLGGCDSDDGITDTPNQASSYASCEKEAQSCGTYDMTQNFMQSNADSCLLFFTKGQAEKMNAVLQHERKVLSENAKNLVGFQDFVSAEKLVLQNVNGTLKISFGEKPIGLRFYNTSGFLFYQNEKNTKHEIETHSLSSGIYLIQLVSEKEIITQKIYLNTHQLK